MPLIHQQQLNPDTKIGVWHITETEVFFLQQVSLQRSITHPHKRLQHLAGRYLLKTLFPGFPLELILIADTRKPFLKDDAFHFSVSHCGNYAAAIVSTANRVGVDIEIPHPKIERVKHKFLSETEEQVIALSWHPFSHMLTMAWSIKEALFKWYGKGGVDFKEHMQIESISGDNGVFEAACIFSKEGEVMLDVTSILVEGNNLSWVVS